MIIKLVPQSTAGLRLPSCTPSVLYRHSLKFIYCSDILIKSYLEPMLVINREDRVHWKGWGSCGKDGVLVGRMVFQKNVLLRSLQDCKDLDLRSTRFYKI